jgi:hypothetical protein
MLAVSKRFMCIPFARSSDLTAASGFPDKPAFSN